MPTFKTKVLRLVSNIIERVKQYVLLNKWYSLALALIFFDNNSQYISLLWPCPLVVSMADTVYT